MSAEIIQKIKSYSIDGRIRLKKHAFIRIVERRIKISEIEEVIQNSEVIAEYPEDKPLESYLLFGYAKNRRPLHILVALDEINRYVWIITVYEPDKNRWNDSLTKRK